ncbi:MAG TPA: FliH/SctL family protein [Bryobacteraceae bacterium]|nr:FliH/SctL family protein [Bryobacteraceae bacterium]
MSSRVQRGIAELVQPMTWRKVNPGTAPEAPKAAGKDGAPSEALRQQMEAQVELRCRQAHDQGRHEGEAAAHTQAQTQIADLASRLARSIEEVTGLRQRMRHEAEQEIVALSLAIARRVLHRELTIEPEAVLGLLKAALERLDMRELHRIRVHPDTALLLAKHIEKIGIPRRVELIADTALERGALVLEASSGSLDASVETQLAEIERGFADLVRRNA